MLNHSPNSGGSNNSDQNSSSKQKSEAININYLELLKNVKKFLYNEDVFKDSDENIIKQGCAQHYIKLERKGFSHFPDFILYSKSLKTELDVLILSHNEIRAIPPDIIQLEALKILDLSHNHHIKNFTYELMNLKNLIGLDLSYNVVERIPDAFFEKMKSKIMVLNLANNNIHSISNGNWADFAKKLIDLNVSDNKIVNIPESLCECYNLTSLNLSGNFIQHLPYNFFKLRKLKNLNLKRNRISDLPMIEYENGDFSIFYDMELLENLDISHNSLSEEYLHGLGTLPNLKKYLFSHNKIETLTPSFGISHSCKYLQVVHLSSNLLEELPTILADNLGNILKELDICNNNITSLGDNFHKFVVLERLLMNRNCLKELPVSIGSLVNLVELKARKNEIELVHQLCFNENMKKLKEVDLDCNFIKEIPSSIFLLPELITLRIEKNQLQSIPDTIVNCPNLYGIYAAYNELKELPDNIGLCKCLRKIHVEYNFLKKLPQSLKFLKTLMIINFDNNCKEIIEFIKHQIELDSAEKEKLLKEYTAIYEKFQQQKQQANKSFFGSRKKKEEDFKQELNSSGLLAAASPPLGTSSNIDDEKKQGKTKEDDEMKTPEEFMAEQCFLSNILKNTKQKENLQCRNQ